MITARRYRIRIEAIGEDGETVPAGEALIETDQVADVADWRWRLDLCGRRSGQRVPWKNGTLQAFPRKLPTATANPFDLFYRVLRQAIHYRHR